MCKFRHTFHDEQVGTLTELMAEPRHKSDWSDITLFQVRRRREVLQEAPQLKVAYLHVQIDPVSTGMFTFAKMIIEVRPFIGN